MATRQQLRGDGSKEYQIITNLSRGINNAVADDVLVDNAFRDVVNFSSDQLGNISKRDNLLNSNFKEFIRKLAYGDFNLDTFKIKDYSRAEYVDGYKEYSFSSIDQVNLQSFYEMLFTNKKYISNNLFSTKYGIAKDNNGELIKTATYIGAPTIKQDGYLKSSFNAVTRVDEPIQNYTSRLNPTFVEDRQLQVGSYSPDNLNFKKCWLRWKDEKTNEYVPILESSVPSNWQLVDATTIYREYTFEDEYAYLVDNISVTLNNENQDIVRTSVVFYKFHDNGSNTVPSILSEENSDGLSYDLYIYNTQAEMLAVDGDYGWEVTDKDVPTANGDSTVNVKALHKNILKTDIKANTVKVVDVLGKKSNNFDYSKTVTIYFSNIANVPGEDYWRVSNYLTYINNVTINKIYVVEQNNFFKQLQNLNQLFKEGEYSDLEELDSSVSFEAWFVSIADYEVFGGYSAKPKDYPVAITRGSSSTSSGKCLVLHKFKFELDTDFSISVYINSRTLGDDYLLADTVAPVYAVTNSENRFIYKVNYTDDVLNDMFLSKYMSSLYITTGFSTLLEIDLDEVEATDFIQYIGAFNNMTKDNDTIDIIPTNVYFPVPYEINNPGFNLLAENPVEAIESAGNVDSIKGVFYTIDGKQGNNIQLAKDVPCNIPFYIHIIHTGDTLPAEPKYRPNNGELDEEKNPYKVLPGSWESHTSGEMPIYKCNGIDNIESYEMKITKGEDDYITYFTPTPYIEKDNASLTEVRSLLLNCQRSKVINNQLVLFGNGGYIFFSDFENFRYFPNYYYIYVSTDINEYVVDIVYFRQFYAIFTNKRILRMSGDFGADNFELGPLNDFMGCVNHSTIRQVYNSLYFIGYNGIYALNQGYLGSGTENLKRIDTQLTNTFNFDNVTYCYVMGNIYIIIMKDGKTWYTYDVDNDMFLRYNYSLGDDSILSNVSFIETLEENQIYAILATNKEANSYTDDLLLYNFPLAKDANYNYEDSNQGYISAFETPYINLGTPTNTKKFKNLFIKMYNETDSLIPLYITVYVDDILAITPEDYVIELDEETNTYFYYFKADNNAELLKAHNLLGELTLGKDTLGDNIIQQLKLKINAKGRAIKIILADGYDYPNKDNSAIINYRNNKKFSISTIGIVYKLKKVKEG